LPILTNLVALLCVRHGVFETQYRCPTITRRLAENIKVDKLHRNILGLHYLCNR